MTAVEVGAVGDGGIVISGWASSVFDVVDELCSSLKGMGICFVENNYFRFANICDVYM